MVVHVSQFLVALQGFIELLKGQSEDEAVAVLEDAVSRLEQFPADSPEWSKVLGEILEAYEEHELMAYAHRRQSTDQAWSEADELYLASTKVLTLARRLQKN